MLCSLEASGSWLYCHPKSLGPFIFPPSWLCMAITRPCLLVAGSGVQPCDFGHLIVTVHFSFGNLQPAAEQSNRLALKATCPWCRSCARCRGLESSTEITISAEAACSYPHGRRGATYQLLAGRAM